MTNNHTKIGFVRDALMCEEMFILNNQLSDMCRELSKKNAELERLKAELEDVLEVRTADLTQEIMEHKQTKKKLHKALKDIEHLKKQIQSDCPTSKRS